ncbi:hypothetical protein SKAU_G00286710 [Synaphobranchus kaupii]|uniref:Cyclin Dx n=1 Tax=Synaphobranchus kaupii TaxID=118154 RepID=A0A9Q1EY88_SYNKA|nr:hypothetical protein SKAU_G00286710 [Synaphobranchus kaupii]
MSAEPLWCEEEGRVAAPGQLRAPWDPCASGERVIQRLLQAEERYLPSTLYVSLVQRDPRQRDQLAKWTLEVCCECGCEEAVFPLAVSLLDRFLSVSPSLPLSLWSLCAACILISSKLTESETVCADSLSACADCSFTPKDLWEMERVVLATLRWDVAAVTPQDFLPHFLSALGEKQARKTQAGVSLATLRRHSDTLVAMCVCDSDFLGTPPSVISAAALNAAIRGLGNRGPQPGHVTTVLSALCRTDMGVLQYYSDLIEGALRERLRNGQRERQREQKKEDKDGEMEDERASTPTDLREISF